MTSWTDTVLVFFILTNFVLLGTSRLGACVRVVALQGVLMGALALASAEGAPSWRTALLASGSMILKGAVFPWLLSRSLREAGVRREEEPYVGYILSTVSGILALGLSLWLASRLPLPVPAASSLVVPAALFTILAGLFLIVTRKQAISQVVGYLVLENGIYAFGVALVQEVPLLVEMGVLLDVFVAVFVMGIIIFHISREFDHIDTDRLSSPGG